MNRVIYKDFPKEGVNFLDIFAMLQDEESRLQISDFLYRQIPAESVLLVPESRAFLLSGLFLNEISVYIVPFRKEGKLPYVNKHDLIGVSYTKEYGEDKLQVSKAHLEVLKKVKAENPDYKIIVLDDVLATGSTACSIASVIEEFYDFKIDKFVFLGEVESCEGRTKCEQIAEVKTLFYI